MQPLNPHTTQALSQYDKTVQPGRTAHPRLSFEQYLQALTKNASRQAKGVASSPQLSPVASGLNALPVAAPSAASRSAVYEQNGQQQPAVTRTSDWEKYKEDQLLSNPGGDAYHVSENTASIASESSDSFLGNIAKDITDAVANVKNFFQDFFFGAAFHYKKPDGTIAAGRKKGVVGSVIDLVKDLGSALTLGIWRPDGEQAPQGMGERLRFSWKKLQEAFSDDLIGGVVAGINNMGEDVLLAGLNLVEAVPDATIGSSKIGRKIVTSLFDNGQVAIDYLTDVMPGGEAWMRVHTFSLEEAKFPVAYNLKMPEQYQGDLRWQYVRNTPLRKILETLGAGIADAITLRLAGQLSSSGDSNGNVQ